MAEEKDEEIEEIVEDLETETRTFDEVLEQNANLVNQANQLIAIANQLQAELNSVNAMLSHYETTINVLSTRLEKSKMSKLENQHEEKGE